MDMPAHQTTILIVDSDKTARENIKAALINEHYRIFEAATGRRMLEILQEYAIELILLDTGLPDGGGLTFIDSIRAYTGASLIILSSQNNEEEKIMILDNEADDYIIKPFMLEELRVRIKAALRRRNHIGQPGKIKHRIKFDRWILDPNRCQIYNEQNNEAGLTLQEYHLLEALLQSSRRVLDRNELISLIADPHRHASARAIDVHITRLRRKIGDNAASPRIIRTVRGAGYMLDCRTEIVDEEESIQMPGWLK